MTTYVVRITGRGRTRLTLRTPHRSERAAKRLTRNDHETVSVVITIPWTKTGLLAFFAKKQVA